MTDNASSFGDPNLPTMGKAFCFQLSDDAWQKIAHAGALPEDVSLRGKLEDLIGHDLQSRNMAGWMPSSIELRNSMTKIILLTEKLAEELNSHQGIQTRMRGIASALDGGDNSFVDQLNQSIKCIEHVAKFDRKASNHSAGDRLLPGPANTLPIRSLFISSLLNFWWIELNRQPYGRVPKCIVLQSERIYGPSDTPSLTRFVHECMASTGGSANDMESLRRAIQRTRVQMDKNKDDGRGWSI